MDIMKLFSRRGASVGPHYKALVAECLRELRRKNEANHLQWRMASAAGWGLDQIKGEIIFSFSDGTNVTCSAQIVGTFDTEATTWLWGWANPSLASHLKRDSLKVRQYGEEHGVKKLINPGWKATEDDAWAMTALAAAFCNASGAFRAPMGDNYITYISFGEAKITKSQ